MLGLDSLLEAAEDGRRPSWFGSPPSATRPAARATSPARTRFATSARGWEIRDTPEGAKLFRADERDRRPVIVYGRNPVREALRGRRRVQRVFATARAARGLARRGGAHIVDAYEVEDRCDSPDHQGICAEVEAYPYAQADDLSSAEDALVLALDEVKDPQNLGAVCRVAKRPAARGRAPGAPLRGGHAGGLQGVGRAVEHLAVARVRNLADWLGTAKERDAWIYGAAADAEVPYHRPDYQGRVVLVLGSEGRAAPPRGGRVRPAGLPAAPRPRGLAQRLCGRAALVYGILHFRASA